MEKPEIGLTETMDATGVGFMIIMTPTFHLKTKQNKTQILVSVFGLLAEESEEKKKKRNTLYLIFYNISRDPLLSFQLNWNIMMRVRLAVLVKKYGKKL